MSTNNKIHETYPLSPVQKGILFHSLEQHNSGVYLQQFICNLNENINIEVFEQAWQKIIERHTVLRTGFQWQDLDEPQQLVYKQVNCPLHFEDWSDIYDPEIQLASYLESDKKQGFDFTEAPLIRLALFKFSEDDYRFIWTHHHIILDGRSYFILFKELFNIYTKYNENKELELSRVYPYSEYIEWLEQENFFKSEPFWRKSLSGVEAPTPLIKSVESVVEEEAYLEKTYDFSETLTEGLKFFAEENGLTLNTLVQAAWAILLNRYSGEDKVIFGATRACRHWTQIEPNNRVGIFINTLPFSTQLDANMDVLTWLNSLRSHWVEMREHEHTPLTQIQQWSEIRSDSPLFESIVVFENTDLNSALRAQGGDWEKRNFTLLQTTNYPLLLAATVDSCLHLMLEYETTRFDSDIINRMFGHLKTILISIIANPTQNLSEISLLTKLEKNQLLVEWNNTAADYPLDKCVHQLFEEQVEKTPDAIAVKFEDQQLTYRELNARANQVAHHLDVKPDTLIGLSVERSLEMIVGMLGILKAGAAYVPLDPSYPEERLNFILEDSGIEILLDKERLEQIDEQNVENPNTDVKPNNLAYVIYTSGSTGKPKGVLIEHKSLVNHNFAIIDEYKLTPEDKLLQFASFNFDVATEEIFPTLLAGASLVLWKPETANVISDFVEQQQLTVLNLPAQYWHTWVLDFTEKNQTLPACLRLVVAGSETVPIETVRLWHQTSDIDLRNAYGPTESTITATTYKAKLLSEKANSVPIGSPIANTEIFILDKNQQIVPIGVPGELHIGGIGLARGYLNRPELTAEKFISLFNQRLYKTGDLVRHLPDGNIEFLGRIDNQVKIRGFRIELGEIESVIMQHVREAAVIVREDQPGNKRLVAYTVGSTEGLRDFVKAELPHYMVPSVFVSLDKMPLMPNGKIDRRALPVPDQTEFEANFVAPRNSVEEKIAEIWKKILALKQVGIHDNFFELGGHSLLATQIVSRLNITLQNLFEYPTVAELAEIISQKTETKETVIIPRSDQHDVVSFAQQRLWFLDQLESNTAMYNIPAAFKISGNLNIAALQQSLNTIVERHEIIRTILKDVDGKPVPVVIDNASVDLAIIKLNAEADAETFIRLEAAKPFDISTDLMLRATLLEVNSNEFVLILMMHHIASDGWSIGILFDELSELYKGNTLPELAIQYSDFAVWQRQYLSDQVLENKLSYWKQQLDGMPTTLELATDKSRPATLTTNGKTRHFVLPVSLANKLKTLSQEQGSTLFMTLLGAFKILLHRYSGQDDIVVGSPIAGRNQPELENLIGFFVNTLVLRSKINRDSSFIEFLGHVREVALGAYAHQDVPFEKLVSELQPERDVSRTPLFQVMFVLQNANQQDLQLPDLNIKPLLANNDTAKFDLTLDMVEEANSELTALFEYNTDLFDDSTIERMMVHFQTLLESIVANPKQSISELEILNKAEKDQLLVEWNNTAADYPLDKCVHQLFEEQVEKTPDAIAVKFEDQELTYRELNQRANQVAHHLDVKPDTLVGLSLERSLEMIVGMLGILKAGAAYVPLDPSYPEERLNFILEDSGIEILLDKEALEQIDEQNIENPSTDVKPNNLAYVIYTSGSTGKPKGVLIEHKSLVNHNFAIIDEYKLTPEDKLLQFASFNFDVATEEIFPTLLSGATLVLWKAVVFDFTNFVEQQQLTVLNLPAQYWHTWVLNEKLPSCLRLVIAGSETVPLETVRLWHQTSDIDLRNAYGPTECTITATTYKTKLDDTNSVPIGKPIANTEIFILDKNQQIVPIGVPGELHIGGIGLARGYLNRPELTAEKFIALFNQRLYKTGDLVRYLPDGNIEFLGRIDNQVKIRGFRIELGEIESVIMQHVSEAVVIVREDQPGNKRLVAYTVGSTEDLRDFVKAELPHYMVPSAFISLEKMPLMPNGKIDRRALPVPDQSEFEANFVAPRNSVEEKIAEIWKEILALKQVGIHDNFFELGGHSLLATQIVSRLNITLQNLFEYPTVAELAERMNLDTKETVIIPRSDQHDVVSFAQQRLWFLDQLEPNTDLYNIPAAFKISGNLNVARLQKTLNTIVERHEIIRTILKKVDGKPVPVVLENVSIELPIIKVNQEAEIQNLINEEAARPFDISTDLMLRATLLEVNSNEFVLILMMHHIASDGWSIGILFDELSELYKGNTLPELAIQYSDFAVWQRQWLSEKNLDEQLGYWKQQLEGMPTTLELPIDRQRPATQTTNGKTSYLTLPASLTKALKTLSQQQSATLFMTLLGVFEILLHRYSRQDDIVVGSPIAGRNKPEVEDLIGFFVNNLVLRSQINKDSINKDSSFIEFLGHVREVALGAYAHQDVPFDKLVSELQSERDVSRHPLFQVMFILQNTPMQEFKLPDLSISSLLADTSTAKCDLLLDIEEQANSELIASFEYNTDLFNDATIERMMVHFQTLLESVVANPNQSISELEILSQSEKDQLLIEWNNTRTDYNLDKCIHQIFEEQVEKNPNAIAVKFEDQQLTYRELNERANQLAHHLQTLGVKADVVVGIYIERSIEMVIGLFGILKAGGTYVPLDPAYPEERLTFMLTDSQALVLLTQEKLLGQLPKNNIKIICLDKDWELIAQQKNDNPNVELNKENLAYIIYTSGSTGKPKGVMIPHQAISNYIQWMQTDFPLNESDKVLQKTPFSFDASVWEFYAPLLAGAQLIVAKHLGHRESDYLIKVIINEQVTVIQATSSLLQMLLLNKEFKTCISLKRVFCGGEALSLELKNSFLDTLNASLYNLYGPTETCIYSTSWKCQDQQNVYIGNPIANTQVYILDKNQTIVPIGVPGELHIGGVGLARGYLNRPELTAKQFISHPLSKLYKTGDLVRYLPDGNIEYLGRIDNQVKIRGVRIELGEIESVLMQHSDVSEVAVIVREDQPGDKRLVAYIVNSSTVATDDLRKFVKAKLPNFMLPSAFVSLEKMPLTPSVKIDRRALPAPTDVDSETRNDFIAPRNQLEQQVTEIWQKVLNVNSISVHDNFFELGGHSLLATQIVSRLNITLQNLFEYPTVAELAEIISQKTETKETVIIPRSDQHDVVSFAQQRLWFLEQLESNTAMYNIPAAFKISGNLNIATLQKTLNTIVERHEIIRTILKKVDGKPVPVVLENVSIELPIIKVNQETEIQNLINEEAARPFDISNDLMLRATLLEVNSNEFVLILMMHHIASDGWSIGILFDELSALYQGNTLDELAIQYSDFAVWQQQWLSDKNLEEQLSYWKQQLEGMPTTLELPIDRQRPATQTTNGKTLDFLLPASLGKALKTLSQQQGVTLFMTLLGVFKVLLHRYTNQNDIVIGSPIAGRNQPELENLIGFFVNTLVLRSKINRDSSFIEFLGHVREVALGAYAHQDVPFEKLVSELQVERDVSRHPLFQVMFDLQNASEQDLQLPDFSIKPLLANNDTAKFDLLLDMAEEANSELTASFEYNTDLFDDSTIERMMVHFQTLLESIVANPQQSISELEILNKAEKDQLLVEWNNTAADYPLDKCVHQLFEEQVEKTPDAIAVKFEDQQLTYRELNERANQVAHHLDVKPDTLIGLSVERSLEMIVGILGILKSGAAYVPLDPNYPEERLNFILEDSGIEILLDKEALEQIDEQNVENPSTDVKPNNLAYVIYTSGSTGKPKGVLIEHKSLVNHTLSASNEFELNEDDRVLQFASISFDAAAEEIYPCLITGATLVLRTNEMLDSISIFLQKCNDWGLTLIDLPTAYWHEVTSQLNNENRKFPSSVRLVIIGGEEALKEQLVKWKKYVNPTVKLFNTYGPTEATIVATRYLAINTLDELFIGKPIANTQAYILDKYQNIAPIGVAGELHIGGVGLARGYLNRPELTAEKFISLFNQRLYKTGDLVRYLPAGNIEFLGRIDNQVKIRGFRIELGEIESVIMKHVSEVAVIVREDQPGNKRLVAYTVGSTDGLRDAVKAELPHYMVPSVFVSLEKMPLTPNGKIDRRALPVPTEIKTDAIIAPRDKLEQQLADIWQQVLGVNSISVHDNFFDLGGHSLLAITLLGKIEQAFDKTISVIKLFQAPTIAQFADILRDKDHTPTWRALLPILTQGQRKPLFFIGSTDYARLLVASLGNEQPIYGLNMFGLHSEGDTNPVLTVETMATEYLQEIRTVQPEGPYHLCGYCADAKVAFEMAQQLNKQGQEVAYLGFIDVNWYADSSLSLNQRVSKLGKNIAKFGTSLITHKIKAKLKELKESKVLSQSEKDKLRYERSGESLPLQLQHQFLIKEFWNALDDYQAQTYSGNLNLLLSSELIAEWEVDKSLSEQINNLITGTVIVEEIQGFHDTLFVEPQISVLGKQIKLHLESLVYK